MTFESQLQDLLNGHITADKFFRDTAEIWKRMAKHLLRRWSSPAWVDVEEISQELMIGAWRCIWNFEPTFGTTLTRYVAWNAMDYAKKKLHRMRGAKLSGSADRNPSRYEIPFTAFDVTFEWLEGKLTTDGEQQDTIEQKENLQHALHACETQAERTIIQALHVTGSIEKAAELIDSERDMRFECMFTSSEQAPYIVAEAAMAVAERIQQSAA
jgi:DNA-directed RNA polymerase specialized sigma24 family protein